MKIFISSILVILGGWYYTTFTSHFNSKEEAEIVSQINISKKKRPNKKENINYNDPELKQAMELMLHDGERGPASEESLNDFQTSVANMSNEQIHFEIESNNREIAALQFQIEEIDQESLESDHQNEIQERIDYLKDKSYILEEQMEASNVENR